MEIFPEPVVLEILHGLPPQDLLPAACVARDFANFAKSELLWHRSKSGLTLN